MYNLTAAPPHIDVYICLPLSIRFPDLGPCHPGPFSKALELFILFPSRWHFARDSSQKCTEPRAVRTGWPEGLSPGRAAGEGEQSLKWGMVGPHLGRGQQGPARLGASGGFPASGRRLQVISLWVKRWRVHLFPRRNGNDHAAIPWLLGTQGPRAGRSSHPLSWGLDLQHKPQTTAHPNPPQWVRDTP